MLIRHRDVASRWAVVVLVFSSLAACSREAADNKSKQAQPAKVPTTLEVMASGCTVDEFHVNGLRQNASAGQIYFAHPQSVCSIEIPAGTRYVRFAFGVDDGAIVATPKTGGVVFKISSQGSTASQLWSRTLNPATVSSDRGLQTGLLKLETPAPARLVFETAALAGKTNNWAYWARLSLDKDLNLMQLLGDNKVTDQFGVSGLRDVVPVGKLLFAHPHSVFAMPLLAQAGSLQFGYGILDEVLKATPKPEGVIFRLILEDQTGHKKTLWSHTLNPVTVEADRGTHQETVPIPAAQGGRLLFETSPLKDAQNNWAYWTNLSLTDAAR
jgi:hypothetical protein